MSDAPTVKPDEEASAELASAPCVTETKEKTDEDEELDALLDGRFLLYCEPIIQRKEAISF